ncbi:MULTISPECIES: beta-glucoside-specific PTS transporter subunit IIABC [Enterococcus]|uniref:beta-glucoside-specific PTS transporter subunit IIABC n=1 Tax=Enterococcus TaxID=1350 RepID=UPI0002A468FD|nr:MULTISPECIES: beta-glucoside-specific PTS transporter subunit IIABC [Enterococcus]EGP4726538.1 PTS transporter subunit EIIC [Enterococcus faecium]EGP4897429.1 PTS transporter subunit EIIC [Enterococcus faecium]EGP5124733.1 PTS beta-glucoside transporter subunit EIIBCA [Enterococcus faecium]EGP5325564.1 PTS beta-glucoside transporter subunit EIIBCA [Enterococcus faecium]EGP5652100.1 PTS beta-glucoside transporter subunit EIIBCA [Enterococcus faecium]
MDVKKTAVEIVKAVGGTQNIQSATHCMSRLRLVLKNDSLADDSEVENIDGVKGIMKQGGQYQIIIGGEVSEVFNHLPKGLRNDEDVEDLKQDKSIKGYLSAIFDYISGSLTGALPVILGGGMVKLLVAILGLMNLGNNPTVEVLNIIGDVGFYFLPIYVAYVAATKINTDIVLSMAVSAILLHPSLIAALSGDGLSFFGLPIYATSYASAVIPPLFATWVLKMVLKGVDKITPGWTKSIFRPMLALMITIPIVLIVFAPLGAIIGEGLVKITEVSQSFSPWLTMTVLAALMPLLIMTGMHHAFDPIMFANFAGPGYDGLFLPLMLATNFALTGSIIAVALKTKNTKFKTVAVSSAISAGVAGITEPGLFGVVLRLKRPLFASMIGSGIAGLFVGIFNIKSYALASPGLIAMIQFIDPDGSSNFMNAVIVAVIGLVSGFIFTYLLGFEGIEDTTDKSEAEQSQSKAASTVGSPMNGEFVLLENINDATFAQKLLGDGVAIVPSEGKVYSPVNGTVQVMFKTGHAIGLLSDNGDELLIHVGMDTVKLEGRGFSPKVKDGDKATKGQLLLEFDRELLIKEGFDITTPIIVTNLAVTNKTIDCSLYEGLEIVKGQKLFDLN